MGYLMDYWRYYLAFDLENFSILCSHISISPEDVEKEAKFTFGTDNAVNMVESNCIKRAYELQSQTCQLRKKILNKEAFLSDESDEEGNIPSKAGLRV